MAEVDVAVCDVVGAGAEVDVAVDDVVGAVANVDVAMGDVVGAVANVGVDVVDKLDAGDVELVNIELVGVDWLVGITVLNRSAVERSGWSSIL